MSVFALESGIEDYSIEIVRAERRQYMGLTICKPEEGEQESKDQCNYLNEKKEYRIKRSKIHMTFENHTCPTSQAFVIIFERRSSESFNLRWQ